MRRRLPSIIAVLMLAALAAATLWTLAPARAGAVRNHPKKPAPYGVLGVGWGQHLGSLYDLRIFSGDGFVNYYYRPGERVQFGEAMVREVLYGFYDNRFFSAFMPFEGHTVFRRLVQAMTDIHGQADVEDDYDKLYIWRWEHVKLEVEWDQRSGEGAVHYLFLPIAWEAERDRLLGGRWR